RGLGGVGDLRARPAGGFRSRARAFDAPAVVRFPAVRGAVGEERHTYIDARMLSAADIARHPGPLVVCTAFAYALARVLERAGVDMILVGGALADVGLGLQSTRGVGMPELEMFAGALPRGAPGTHVTVDMP